jgi:hypothetical protein
LLEKDRGAAGIIHPLVTSTSRNDVSDSNTMPTGHNQAAEPYKDKVSRKKKEAVDIKLLQRQTH